MYLSYYHLTDKPFQISTDTRFLWLSENHREALANLKYGLLQNNGFVVLTGAVGTGKTTLVNALLEMLDESVRVATINHPTLDALDFLRLIAKSYDPQATADNKADLLLFFKAFLQQAHERNQTVLLVIDEAHRLSATLLEEVRLLSNMEQSGQRLLNIFFVGQSELNTTLSSPNCEALRQRITLYYELEPFSETQTVQYVRHRLKIAGTEQPLFTPGALKAIQRFTGGYPRSINILCDRALLTGYVRERIDLDEAVIAECISEISIHPTKANRRTNKAAISGPVTGFARKAALFTAARIAAGAALTMHLGRDAARAAARFISAIPRPWVLASLPAIAAVVLVVASLSGKNSEPVFTPEPAAVEEKAVTAVAPAVPHEAQPPATPDRDQAPRQESAPAPDNTELAETALTEKEYQTALALLEAAQQEQTATARTAALYSRALVGLAEEILAESPGEALAMLDKAAAADPANASAYFGLGKIYGRQKEYARAIDAYRHALRLDPAMPEAYFNLGFIYATTERYERAEEMFARVVQMKPDFLDKALFNLAVVQHKRGENMQSIANMEKALAIRPDNRKVQAYLDQFRAALNN
jgi:type II secretory pathway predicted ATPase ExeA/TolA-binding protein